MTTPIQGGESTGEDMTRRIPTTAAPLLRRDTCSPPSLTDRCDAIWMLLEREVITADRYRSLGYHEMADFYDRRAQGYSRQLEQLVWAGEVAS